MFYKASAISFFAFLFVSCASESSPEQKKEEAKKDSSVQIVDCASRFKEAERLDNILLKSNSVNAVDAENAIKAFYEFASNCKDDDRAPVFLVKAGQVAQSIRKYTQAQAFFQKCVDEFPQFKSRGAAMFLLAQLYDDPSILNNESEAKTIYHQIIREYPQSAFANDAKAAIQNLGKSDEELVKEFLKKNK